MGCISQKVKFKYVINTSRAISNEMISQKNYKLLADIEGKLKIYIDNTLFFDADYVLLLEFAVDLQKWIDKISNNDYQDFFYTTMDYYEGPILEFKRTIANKWAIHSVWSPFQTGLEIEFNQLTECIKLFLAQINEDLPELYNIHLSEFV